ncbi:thioesterase II family protein [Ketobacter sp.]|uniref:thioesterase II family protein n=1 Tax=Ketobacter sp. TaxID=2083498 RepID=UPI000F1B1E39|nr:alpha/beta fold hydrolase [Ketobacter sp.]RLU00288.1 MAG: thioesterase [Ketobacter sp.]
MIFGKNKSLACFSANPAAQYRVICFPCAGGGASMYRKWSDFLPDAEVWAANYPGRESLHGMPFSESVADILALFTAQSDFFAGKPFVLYGHSFGAVVAYQLAATLQQAGIRDLGICVSARRAPHLEPELKLADLSEEEFLRELERLGGLPDAIRSNQEMMDFYLPVIKADLALNDEALSDPAQSISTPIYLYSATEDKVANPNELAAWKNATTSRFEHKVFEGGHFFIQDSVTEFMASLRSVLATLTQSDDEELIAF